MTEPRQFTPEDYAHLHSAFDALRARYEYEDSQVTNAEPGRWEDALERLEESIFAEEQAREESALERASEREEARPA